jgi:uncharacterized protein YecE (DUF72 family)
LWFPEWFVTDREKREYLASVRGKLPGYEVAVEFRNKMWIVECTHGLRPLT